jgi:hypothetical protein
MMHAQAIQMISRADSFKIFGLKFDNITANRICLLFCVGAKMLCKRLVLCSPRCQNWLGTKCACAESRRSRNILIMNSHS